MRRVRDDLVRGAGRLGPGEHVDHEQRIADRQTHEAEARSTIHNNR